jgi:hypothetical protein
MLGRKRKSTKRKITHDFDVVQDADSETHRLNEGKQAFDGLLTDSLSHDLEKGASSGEAERTLDEDEVKGGEARGTTRSSFWFAQASTFAWLCAVLGASPDIMADGTEKLAANHNPTSHTLLSLCIGLGVACTDALIFATTMREY